MFTSGYFWVFTLLSEDWSDMFLFCLYCKQVDTLLCCLTKAAPPLWFTLGFTFGSAVAFGRTIWVGLSCGHTLCEWENTHSPPSSVCQCIVHGLTISSHLSALSRETAAPLVSCSNNSPCTTNGRCSHAWASCWQVQSEKCVSMCVMYVCACECMCFLVELDILHLIRHVVVREYFKV